jgi:hypothetical protein
MTTYTNTIHVNTDGVVSFRTGIGFSTSNIIIWSVLIGGVNSSIDALELANGQLVIGSFGARPVAGNITSTDGSATITNGPGTIDISVQNPPWQKTNSNIQMQPNHAYAVVDPSGIVEFALPTNAVPGNSVEINNITGGGIKITQSTNQHIFYEDTITTTGPSGYMQSTERGASIMLRAFENTNSWYVLWSQGNFTGN